MGGVVDSVGDVLGGAADFVGDVAGGIGDFAGDVIEDFGPEIATAEPESAGGLTCGCAGRD